MGQVFLRDRPKRDPDSAKILSVAESPASYVGPHAGPAMTVIAGISNLTDEAPPIISDGTSARYGNISVYGTQYDLAGRTTFVSITRVF